MDRGAAAAISLGIFALKVLGQHRELVLRLLQRRAWFQTRADPQLAIVAVLKKILLDVGRKHRRHRQGNIKVGTIEHLHSRELFGSDSDHGELHAVQPDMAANHGWIAPKFAPPEFRTEHHHGVAPRHLVFFQPKTAPQLRLHGQHMQVVPGNHHSTGDPRRAGRVGAEADRLHFGVGDHTRVALSFVAQVQILAIGKIVEAAVMRGAYQRDDSARMRHGVGPEDQRIHHAESAGNHANPKR